MGSKRRGTERMSATNIMAPEKIREDLGMEEEVLSKVDRLGRNVPSTRERQSTHYES